MNRRGFLAGILAAGAAPWVCTQAGVLMPVKPVLEAPQVIVRTGLPAAFFSHTTTATEVQEWLKRVHQMLDAELRVMRVNPPIFPMADGTFAPLTIPDGRWFDLKVKP